MWTEKQHRKTYKRSDERYPSESDRMTDEAPSGKPLIPQRPSKPGIVRAALDMREKR